MCLPSKSSTHTDTEHDKDCLWMDEWSGSRRDDVRRYERLDITKINPNRILDYLRGISPMVHLVLKGSTSLPKDAFAGANAGLPQPSRLTLRGHNASLLAVWASLYVDIAHVRVDMCATIPPDHVADLVSKIRTHLLLGGGHLSIFDLRSRRTTSGASIALIVDGGLCQCRRRTIQIDVRPDTAGAAVSELLPRLVDHIALEVLKAFCLNQLRSVQHTARVDREEVRVVARKDSADSTGPKIGLSDSYDLEE
ncbi:hypothetical protein PENSPDRAFT_686275 [Peniophora sp. CONT]|nr:hypothetical protein PENSPDRAFT_686275 [Peniophora sp. CONT]